MLALCLAMGVGALSSSAYAARILVAVRRILRLPYSEPRDKPPHAPFIVGSFSSTKIWAERWGPA